MNKKGFTLIELLAVIVVLAIILLIAMPIVLNVINDARQGAFDATAQGMVKAAENEYMRGALDNSVEEKWYEFAGGVQTVYVCETEACLNSIVDAGADKLNFSGQGPDTGTIYVAADGEIGMFISDGTYCSQKEVGKNTTVATTQAECPTSGEPGSLYYDVVRPQ